MQRRPILPASICHNKLDTRWRIASRLLIGDRDDKAVPSRYRNPSKQSGAVWTEEPSNTERAVSG
jgi:hypothetical protein